MSLNTNFPDLNLEPTGFGSLLLSWWKQVTVRYDKKLWNWRTTEASRDVSLNRFWVTLYNECYRRRPSKFCFSFQRPGYMSIHLALLWISRRKNAKRLTKTAVEDDTDSLFLPSSFKFPNFVKPLGSNFALIFRIFHYIIICQHCVFFF